MSTELDDLVADPTAAPSPTDSVTASRAADRRRWTVLSWVVILVLGAAAVVLVAAARRGDPPSPNLDNVHTVAEHGSVNAIDHRDALIVQARRAPSQTVAEHGSANAIDHREAIAGRP